MSKVRATGLYDLALLFQCFVYGVAFNARAG